MPHVAEHRRFLSDPPYVIGAVLALALRTACVIAAYTLWIFLFTAGSGSRRQTLVASFRVMRNGRHGGLLSI